MNIAYYEIEINRLVLWPELDRYYFIVGTCFAKLQSLLFYTNYYNKIGVIIKIEARDKQRERERHSCALISGVVH